MKPQIGWTGIWQGWLGRWTRVEARQDRVERRLRQEMEVARREVEAAESYFQTVTDPELVDHAIFSMEAARRKYLYLYRQLRRRRGGAVELDRGEAEWI
ncbi:MAG: DUF2508 family protein [Bacillota bacterium]